MGATLKSKVSSCITFSDLSLAPSLCRMRLPDKGDAPYFMQKPDDKYLRAIYETLLNGRCSDSHWSKTKKTLRACELPLTKDGFVILINLRKVSPRYFRKYAEIKERLQAMGREILPTGINNLTEWEGLTGGKFLTLLEEYEIYPNQSTVSRWFKNVGGFRKRKFYDKSVALPLLATALIYKAKTSEELKCN